MIESLLIQFGSLGIVAYVVYFQTTTLKSIINNNTKALVLVKENIKYCEKRNKKKN